MAADKARNPVLHLFEIVKGLGYADDHSGHSYRMDNHGARGDNKGIVRTDGYGDADGMAAAKHQGHGGLGQGRHHFRNGKPRFHISAHGV